MNFNQYGSTFVLQNPRFLKANNTVIIQNIIYSVKEDSSVNNQRAVRQSFTFNISQTNLSQTFLFAWSFSLEDSSFFPVMCWGKQTGMNSNPLCSPRKRRQSGEQREEAPVTREHVRLNVCCNPPSRVGQLPLPDTVTTSPRHIFSTQPVSRLTPSPPASQLNPKHFAEGLQSVTVG